MQKKQIKIEWDFFQSDAPQISNKAASGIVILGFTYN